MASQLFTRSKSPSYEMQMRRNRLRKVLLETLERRELLAADSAGVVFAPGTPQNYMDSVIERYLRGTTADASGEGSGNFVASGARWSNPTGGVSPAQGDSATVTWSIVPDGTVDSANSGTSNLIAFMDSIYGSGSGPVSQRPWFNIFERAYDRWSEVSGLKFVYETADDGAPMANATNRGVAGVRGDVRIGGHNIDGDFGTLAFNYFPNSGGNQGFDGDMIIDTNDIFYFNNAGGPTGENRGLFNVLMHESGHGIGLGHVSPLNQTKLMEPQVSFAFLGAQHDDILGAQQLYGDALENNDSSATATDLGELPNLKLTTNSINKVGDDDWFKFSVPSPEPLSILLQPTGQQYQVGPDGGTPVAVDTLRNQNLSFELRTASGTVLSTQNSAGLGLPEQLVNFALPASGTYYLRVIGAGAATADPQLYDLTVRTRDLGTGPRLLSVAPNSGDIFTFNNTNSLTEAPTELVFRFDGSSDLNASTLTNGIRVIRAGGDGTFGNSNDEVVVPGYLGFGDNNRIVVLRFASTLQDDLYRVELIGEDDPANGLTAIKNAAGLKLLTRAIDATPNDLTRDSVDFDLELGAQVVSVVPQPVDRIAGVLTPQRDVIRVYFNNDDLYPTAITTGTVSPNPTVVDPSFYQLILTSDTVQPNDDQVFAPVSIVYDPASDMAELKFAGPIDQLAGAGTYRLRVGSRNAVVSTTNPQPITPLSPADPAGNIAAAMPLGSFTGAFSSVINQTIVTTSTGALPLDFPGGNFEPGHRDIQDEDHLIGVQFPQNSLNFFSADPDPQISQIAYNFALNRPYGLDASNRAINTSITPDQIERLREVFEFYSTTLGIDFVETDSDGLTVVVGDLFPLGGTQSRPGFEIGLAGLDANLLPLAIMDGAETWDNSFGGRSGIPGAQSFFETAMHEVGHLLGLGHTYDLPPGTIMGETGDLANPNPGLPGTEWAFPGENDIVHGQHLYRPDNRDVDTYSFVVPVGQAGTLTAETIAERLSNSSNLDTYLTLMKQKPGGGFEILAVNNDSNSSDSFLSAELTEGTYFISVTGKGNENFDPVVPNTGSGAVSQGAYQLKLDFKPTVAAPGQKFSIEDISGTPLDGDGDGTAGGNFNFWFRAAAPVGVATVGQPKTIYVDKGFTGSQAGPLLGSPSQPLNNLDINNPLKWPVGLVQPGDVIRVAGSEGTTSTTRPAYEIGRGGVGNQVLSDGISLEVPRGVTMMIDAGAIFKLQGTRISTGSLSASINKSLSALQVLGTPQQTVNFTSYRDESQGTDTNPLNTIPGAGDWGGIDFHEDVDRREGFGSYERKGIFLNFVSNADIRYGGGQITVSSPSPTISPINLTENRPTLINNTIRFSADAAISADPNSFEETRFTSTRYQTAGAFSPDYSRVGPDIRGNVLLNNSTNGLFIKTTTVAGGPLTTLDLAARFDDTDIAHVFGENLIIQGTPGGAVRETVGPDVSLVQRAGTTGGSLAPAAIIRYRITNVDLNGAEGLPSAATPPLTLVATESAVQLSGLPTASGDYVSRRLWRSTNGGAFQLVAELDSDTTTYKDIGTTLAGALPAVIPTQIDRARLDARLQIDPGIIIKSTGSRIEAGIGAQLIAEGTPDRPIVFTSRSDDRYGAGGTFDTNSDGNSSNPIAGNWGGLVARHLSTLSIDNALITYAGGVASVAGGFAGFSAIEVHQAEARIANSRLELNGSGLGGNVNSSRDGHGPNDASVIFVVASQPTLINNTIQNNSVTNTAAISINANALNTDNVSDPGRQTGAVAKNKAGLGNVGPLVDGNRLLGNGLNGMRVRGETLTTETVWDDTDIVHILQSEVIIPDFHTFGGLRLQSKADESLVVKLAGAGAGLTALGRPLDITDRIGGSLRIIGTPGFPVVMTSITDDSVGAGFDPNGRALVDTNNNGPSTGSAGAWRSIRLEPYANDRNVDSAIELETDQIQDTGTNDVAGVAQGLGALASSLQGGDENLRLGFSVDGSIAAPQDLDVYSFTARAGTPVWIDIDHTNGSLDSVVELIDGSGQIIAQSNNSLAESAGTENRFVTADAAQITPDRVLGLDQDVFATANSFIPGTDADLFSVNPLDAGLRVVLPGATGATNTYYVRVRSSNLSPGGAASLQNPADERKGLTTGNYRLQVRLQQDDEVPGSTVRYADIRFATNGIETRGQTSNSPLLGTLAETGATTALGNIGNSDRGSVTVSGIFDNDAVDVYSFTVRRSGTQVIDPASPSPHIATTIDIDYADGFGRPDTTLWVFDSANRLVLVGTDSNIADDRAAPEQGSDLDDLTRGSNGGRDPFIGAAELPAGNYTVVVSNNSQYAQTLNQFQQAAATNPLVRVEPINSVQRISEDRFEAGSTLETSNGPVQVSFANDGDDAASNQQIVQWTLADLTAYVIQDTGLLMFANPYTGAREADVSDASNTARIGDIAMSPDGRLVASEIAGGNLIDSTTGNLLLLNSTGTLNSATVPVGATVAGNSGLQTYTTQITAAGATPTFAIQQRDQNGLAGGNTPQGDGFIFNGLSFATADNQELKLFGVGSRARAVSFNLPVLDANNAVTGILQSGGVDVEVFNGTNVVYKLNADTGAVINPGTTPVADRTGNALVGNHAGTQKVEFGRFLSGSLTDPNGPFTAGTVTGLAQIGNTLFAVSDLGEFYAVNIGDGDNAFTSNLTVNTGAERFSGRLPTRVITDGGTPVSFTSLTRGPRNLEPDPLTGVGKYANMLFATTADGTIYAVNTAGVFQPVFPGLSYKVRSTDRGGLGNNVVGFDFSPLDVNLFHLTDRRDNEAGHGRQVPYDNSQAANVPGDRALYFGFEDSRTNTGAQRQQGDWTNLYNVAAYDGTYNLPGGAHGAIVSNPIDLRGYSADDLPTLYFNYFLDTENANSDLDNTGRMRDAFRVYGAGEDGAWVLLATNNTPDDQTLNRNNHTGDTNWDEFDNDINKNNLIDPNENFDPFGNPLQTQEAFDGTGWRQIRTSLGAFAGQENVRLRFEFSTAASFETGDPLRGGVELIAVDGAKLTAGTGFTVAPLDGAFGATTNFVFDMGLVLNLPSGASLTNGVSSLNVNGVNVVFSTTSNTGNNIQYSLTDSPAAIATKVAARLAAIVPGITGITTNARRSNVLNIAGLPNGTAANYSASADLGAGIVEAFPQATPGVKIPVTQAMTADQIRDAIRTAFATTFSDPINIPTTTAAQRLEVWKFHANTIQLYKYDITANNSGLGITTERFGDYFGANSVTSLGGSAQAPISFAHLDERALNNTGEGLYIDDIIIGFAERGEMVAGAAANNTFAANRQYAKTLYDVDQIEAGRYQLTVRTAADFGTTDTGNGRLVLDDTRPFGPQFGRQFDTNDRLTQQVGIEVLPQAAGGIADGVTFTLSDGRRPVTFEFDVTTGAGDAASGVQSGNVRIPLSSNATQQQIAIAIRDAINSPTVQGLLKATASLQGEMTDGSFFGDVALSGATTVLLHGDISSDDKGNFTFPANTFLQPRIWGVETAFGEDGGDSERVRPQGQILLVGNTITNSQGFGIFASAGNRDQSAIGDAVGNRPYPGAPINFPTPNTSQLASGVVIINNIVASNAAGGIRVQGETGADAPAQIARILNNTIYGIGGADNGILIENNATPTILNNIIANVGTGVRAPVGSSAVLGANVYQSAGANVGVGLGSFPETLTPAQPLFVDVTNRRFYLAAGSLAIDSSIEALQERPALAQVKNAIGLPESPMLAPDLDVTGQRRVDDPTVNSPAGLGGNVFKDRGAVDRSDFIGLDAIILQPQDNDSLLTDADRNVTYIQLDSGTVDYFSILLQDNNGTGPNSNTVVSSAVTLTENGRLLREGIDYVFGYNANSRTVRLTPIAGIWRTDSVYEITLNNQRSVDLTVGDGDAVADGDTFTIAHAGGNTVFELDSNGAATNAGAKLVPFTTGLSRYEIALQLRTAINNAGIGVNAVSKGDGTITVTNAISVVASGTGVSALNVAAIADLAGNPLFANRANSLTQFTIVMPDAGLDFGDASGTSIPVLAAPNSSTAPVVTNGNGARHVVLPIDVPLLALGSLVDTDANGQPTAAADGDDADTATQVLLGTLGSVGGLTLGQAGPATLSVPAGAGLSGQNFVITDLAERPFAPVTFEFATNTIAGGIVVPVLGSDSANAVAVKVASAINSAVLSGRLTGLTAVAIGSNISLGGSFSHLVDLTAASSVSRLLSGNVEIVVPNAVTTIADGQTMNVVDGSGNNVTFEINNTNPAVTATPVASGNVAISVNLATATATDIATAISVAINGQVAARKLALGTSLIGRATTTGVSLTISGDDEDGVSFGGLFNAGSAPVPISVVSTGAGLLDAWIDWNHDGDFNDANEKLFGTSQPVHEGVNVFDVQTPASAAIGFTTARFRLSTLGDLLPSGVGVGGEVEDHLIEIVAGAPPVAATESYAVNEDSILTVTTAAGVLANDTDADILLPAVATPGVNIFVFDQNPRTTAIEPRTTTANGTLVLNLDGSFTYTPNLDFNGTDRFVYFATDGRLRSNLPITVTITVNPVNDAPLGVDDTISATEDELLVRSGSVFTANDLKHNRSVITNEDGQVITLVGAAIVAEQTSSFGVSGLGVKFASQPSQGAYGIRVNVTSQDLGLNVAPTVTLATDTINVVLNSHAASPTTVNQLIAGVNSAASSLVVASLVSGSGATTLGDLATTYSPIAVPPRAGSVSVNAQHELVYTPPANYNSKIGGPAIVRLTIEDDATAGGPALQSTSLLTINIAERNDNPEFTVPATTSTTEDVGLVTVNGFLTGRRPGPSIATDEATGPAIATENQQVTYTVRALDPSLFAVLPTITPSTDASPGTLSYQLKPDLNQVTPFPRILVEVIATDTGLAGNVLINRFDPSNVFPSLPNVYDGARFTVVDTNGNTVVFELNDATNLDGVGTTSGVPHAPIQYVATDTLQTLNAKIVAAINAPPTASIRPGTGAWAVQAFADLVTNEIKFTGDSSVTVPTAARVTALDNLFPALAAGTTFDGATFTLADADGDWITFELNDTTDTAPATAGVASSHVAINYDPTFTRDQLSAAIVQAINNPPATFAARWNVVATLPGGSNRLQLANVSAITLSTSTATIINPLAAKFIEPAFAKRAANTSTPSTFTIVPAAVNDAPEYTLGANPRSLEDQGVIVVPGFMTGIRKGPVTALDEVVQTLSINIVANPSSFTATGYPTIDLATGNLTYQTAPQVNDSTGHSFVVEVTVSDNGGTALGGVDRTVKTFTIGVTERNDSPEFSMPATTPTVEDAGLVTVNGFLTNRRPGDVLAVDEATGPAINTENQQVTYTVRALDPSLFSVQPTITPSTDAAPGTLSYQLNPDLNQVTPFPRILVEVVAVDSGATGHVLINRFDPTNVFPAVPNIYDGATVTIVDTNGNTVVFELNDATNLNGVGTTGGFAHAAVNYLATDTAATLSAKLVAAFNNPPAASIKPGTGAWAVGSYVDAVSGEIKFTGTASVVAASPAPVTVIDNLFPALVAGTSYDRATFTLTDANGDWITFEFNDTSNTAPATTGVAAGHVAINYDSTTFTQNQLSQAISNAINNPPAQFAARWNVVSTLPAGTDRLQLSGVASIALSTSTATIINPLSAKSLVPVFAQRDTNRSVPRTFTIVPEAVNDAPEFTLGANPTSLEDQGVIVVPGFMTGIRKGPITALDEVVQTLSISIAADVNAFTATGYPKIDLATGNLTYQTAPNVNQFTGQSFVIDVTVSDNGGTALGGVDFTRKSFAINVTERNDAAEFTMPTAISAFQEDPLADPLAPTVVPSFVTSILPGPSAAADEGAVRENQNVTFTVTALDPTLFSTLPTITTAPGGTATLTYRLNTDVNQIVPFPTILVEVVAVDTGAGGNVLINRFDPARTFPSTPNLFDGAKVTVVDSFGNTAIFELEDSVNLPGVGSTGGFAHVAIPYSSADTSATLGQKIAAAISSPPLASIKPGIPAAPWAVKAYLDAFSNEIRFTGEASVSSNSPAPVTLLTNQFPALVAGTSYDGASFTLTDIDGDSLTYEFNDTTNTAPATAGVAPGRVAINYDPSFTRNQLSQAIHTAINTPPAAIAARWNIVSILPVGSDRLELSGVVNTTVSPSTASVINPLLVESLQSVFAQRDANKSVPRTFTILPNPINDAPEFTITQAVVSVSEDSGAQTIPAFVTGARPGPITALDELALQSMTITVTALDPSAFTAAGQPTIVLDPVTGNGVLTFETNSDVNSLTGHDLRIRVTLKDSGGVVNPADVDTTVKTFALNIAPINDAPSFDLPSPSLTFFEDQEQVDGTTQTVVPNFATNVVAGPSTALDETVLATQQTVSFTIVSVSNPGLFETQPTLTWNGSTLKTADLQFKTKPHQNGQSEIVVRLIDSGPNASTGNGDINQSVTDKTFTINLTPVNDPPEFSNTVNASSIEDQGLVVVPGFLSAIRPGPVEATDEAAQVVTIHAQPVDPAAFSVFSIAVDGTLTYRTAPDVNRLNANLSFDVFLTDNGTAGPTPDNNRSATVRYTIDVEPINDRPSFTITQVQVDVIEDVEQFLGTTQTTVPGYASNILRGPLTASDEAGQTLSFQIVSVSAPELFSVQPVLNPVTGDLTFTTAQHKNGKSVVVARLVDDGLASPAPNDRNSILHTFTISIAPINDAPEFTIQATVTYDEDAGLISRSGFASGVRRGPVGSDDENSQLVRFDVVAQNPSLFSVQPAIGVDGTLTFQTAPDVNSANTQLLVEVTLVDNGANSPAPNINHSTTRTFTIVVNAVNDAPTTDAFSTTVDEDSSIQIQAANVLVGDRPGPTTDENGQSLRMTQVQRTSLQGGVVTPIFDVLDPTKIVSLTYAPPANFVGEDTVLYVVTDNGSPERSGTGTITLSVSPINDPPRFNRGPDQAIAEDVPPLVVPNWATGIFAGPASAADELASQTVSFTVVAGNPALFSVQPAVASDGTLTYTLAKDANGSSAVVVTAVDDGSGIAPNIRTSAPQTFTISVSPINDAPVFTAGSNVNVLEDSGLYSQPWATNIAAAAGLLENPQTALDEQTQVIDFEVIVDRPELFSVQPRINSSGTLEFTPVGNAFEQAVVVVTAVDRGPASPLDQPRSASQTFTITIAPGNDAPVAVADNYATNEDSLLTVEAPGLLANDTDVDLPLDTLTVVAGTITSDLGATVTIGTDGSLSYDARTVASFQQLVSGQSISDTFVYQVRDAAGTLSNSATVTIAINGVDDAPEAANDFYSVGVGLPRDLDVLANDTDVDSTIDPRTIVIKANPGFGTVSVNQTGVVTYTPEGGFRGNDSFRYTVRDTAGNESNEALVLITVNSPPVASNDSAFTFKNEPVDINVLTNDRDVDGTVDPDSVRIEVSPSPNGTVQILTGGVIRFTPAADFFGDASFSYSVQDNVGTASNVANVNVRVQNSRWQNPQANLDVNADGAVSPIDVLLIINYLNAGNSSFLPGTGIIPEPYLDPTGDELVTPQDVLAVINFLNANSQGGQGEGESTEYAMMVTPQQVIDTVGRQVVDEIQAAINESLMEHENSSCKAFGVPASNLVAEGEGEDDLLELLSSEGAQHENSTDEAIGQFFGDLPPKRPR